jgi:hypothetical protein
MLGQEQRKRDMKGDESPVAHAPQKVGFGKQVAANVGCIDPVRAIVKTVHHQMWAE